MSHGDEHTERSQNARDVPEAPLTLARAHPANQPRKDRHEIWQLLDAAQMDVRAAAAKLVALRAQVSQMDLPEPIEMDCPRCGIRTKGPITLSEHLYYSHDGPTPAHWGFEA